MLGTSEFPNTPTFIVEPVKISLADLKKTLKAFEDSGTSAKIVLIVNPSVGELPDMTDLIDLANSHPNTVIPAFIPGNPKHIGTSTDFIANTTSPSSVLVHEFDNAVAVADSAAIRSAKSVMYDVETGKLGASYSTSLTAPRVLIEDAFTEHPNNASYPKDEVFTRTHLATPPSYPHFGDYTIMRKTYREGGGRANAIALHVGYHTPTEIRMRHFVSNPSLASAVQAVMYDDALNQLIAFSTTPAALHTLGMREYIASKPKYPGLAKAKQFGVMHHIQLRSQ